MRRLQGGFSHVVLPIVLFVIFAVGGIGWYVYSSQKPKSNTAELNSESQNQADMPVSSKVTYPPGWKEYRNHELGFSFYYPPAWDPIDDSSALPGDGTKDKYYFISFQGSEVELRSYPKKSCPQGDSFGLSASQGWFEKQGTYYLRWCSESGELPESDKYIEYLDSSTDDKKIKKISDSVLFGYDLTTEDMYDELHPSAEGLFDFKKNQTHSGAVLYRLWFADDKLDDSKVLEEFEKVLQTYQEY